LLEGDYFDVTWPDLYLTPMEKYAKKPDESKLVKKNYIVNVNLCGNDIVDDKTVALEAPVVEVSASAEGEANKADSSDVERPITFSAERPVEDSEAIEEKEPTEHFEQISIFDDDF
jgi:hypothetical protein